MRRRSLLALALAITAASGASVAQHAARPSTRLYLHGNALQAHRIIEPQELAALPPELLGSFSQSRGTPGAEQRSMVRGVRLAALVERVVGLKPSARADWKNLLVTVTATDGYRAHFTWVELANTAAGEAALVVFERDGQPLEAREGAVAVLSPGDFRLGARHVRNALRIEVSVIPP